MSGNSTFPLLALRAAHYSGYIMTHKTLPLSLIALVGVVGAAAPASASAQIPDPVRAMIDAAIAKGDPDQVTTVIVLARETSPEAAAELEEIERAFLASQALKAAQKAREEEEANRGFTSGWSGQGQIGAFRDTGNSKNQGGSAALNLKKEAKNWELLLGAAADYQRTQGVTTRERYLLGLEGRYKLSQRAFLFGLTQWERDRLQGYKSRFSVSGGLGYKLIDTERTQLDIKAGPAWRTTSYINTLQPSDKNFAFLAGSNLDWKVSENLTFTQDLNAVWASDDNSYFSETGLEAALSDKLKTRLSYIYQHHTNPPAGALKTDTLTRFTLIYGF